MVEDWILYHASFVSVAHKKTIIEHPRKVNINSLFSSLFRSETKQRIKLLCHCFFSRTYELWQRSLYRREDSNKNTRYSLHYEKTWYKPTIGRWCYNCINIYSFCINVYYPVTSMVCWLIIISVQLV